MYVFSLLVTPAIRQLFGNSSWEIDLSKISHFSLIIISNASISVSSKLRADVTWEDRTSFRIEFAAEILVEIVACIDESFSNSK